MSRERLLAALRTAGPLLERLDALGDASTWRALTPEAVRAREDFEAIRRVADELYAVAEDVRSAREGFAGASFHLATNVPADLAGTLRRIADQRAIIWWLHDVCGTGFWWDLLGSYDELSTLDENFEAGSLVRWTISAAVTYWDQTLDEDDPRRVDDFDLTGAARLTDAAWFRPDDWLRNEVSVLPMLVNAKTALPKPLKERVDQCFGAFRFGQWMASMAMARSTLEYMLFVRGPACGVEIRGSTLDELIPRFAQRWPGLQEPMDYIRRCGNEVMHPAKDDTVARYPQNLAMARRCLQNLVETARVVYDTER